MAELALLFYAAYLLLAFGLRTALQIRRTGSTGFHGLGGRPGSVEWLAGVGFTVALVMGAAAPALVLADVLMPIAALDTDAVHVLGVIIASLGMALTLYSQVSMGDSWRIGVDHQERTELVTHGPFALVRNPIFAAMIPTALGLSLMVPSALAIAGFVALVVALELQVRMVEEPYLAKVHGEEYLTYAERVGRFFPTIGKLHESQASSSKAT